MSKENKKNKNRPQKRDTSASTPEVDSQPLRGHRIRPDSSLAPRIRTGPEATLGDGLIERMYPN